MDYTKGDAKSWARAHMRGVCNVIIPSFTSDLHGLNEAGIRHDVRHNIELGFWGTLLVSEAGTTNDEYKRFMDIAADEAGGRHHLVVHGTFDTADDIVEMARYGEQAGMSALLLGYPNSFYPKSAKDVFDFTNYVCERTNLATVLFAATHWNFGRLDPTGFPIASLLDAADIPNVVACKHEAGGVIASFQFFKKAKDKGILLSDPFEQNSPLWVDLFGMQWMGTSNYEYVGGKVPEYFALLDEGPEEKAQELFWKLQPARAQRLAEQATFSGANFIHRYLWKYQAWLNGFNGGPVRQPAMKINDGQMRRVRESLVKSGMEPEMADFSEFFVGRNPGLSMPLLISHDDVCASVTMADAIDAMEATFREQGEGQVIQPPRTNIRLGAGFLRVGPAVLQGSGWMGFKAMNLSSGEGVRYMILLYQVADGELVAMMDAQHITTLRTGGTSAVAARRLARSEPTDVAVLGAGVEAWAQLEAMHTLGLARSARVHSRTLANRERFAREAAAQFEIPVSAVDNARETVEGCGIVVGAVKSSETVFYGEWLTDGVFVDSIGTARPDQREIDPATFQRSAIVVVDTREGVFGEAGDAIAAKEVISPEQVVELADLVVGKAQGRTDDRQITLFKSVGTAIQDLGLAAMVYQRARERGLGQKLGDFPIVKPA